jgi:hypothetical protein
MAHRDKEDSKVRFNFEHLKIAIDYLLRHATWGGIVWRSDCTWGSPRLFAIVSLLWAWSDEKLVGDCFSTARRITLAMFPQTQKVANSFQAFLKLLIRWSGALAAEMKSTLHKRMLEDFADLMKIGMFTIMAVDGSRIGLPRTKSNENEFSVKRHKKRRNTKKRKPKKHRDKSAEKKANTITMWITTLWHCGTGLPWDWRLGPSDSSERKHWLEMLAALTMPTLFVGDAGFVGYEYAKTVIAAGHHIIIRVGSNVTLLKQLGFATEREGTVYLWPNKSAKRHESPLVLRLVVCHNGKHPVYLITSILSPREFSDANVLAAYRQRWGIELFYRHLKQTFGMHKLKSRSSAAAYVEMTWSFLGLWCMAAYGLKQLHDKGISPNRLSFAKLIRAFQRMLRDYAQPSEKKCRLRDLLLDAVIDNYQRGDKTSRDYPRKKNEKPPGPPKIRKATKQEIQHAMQVKQQNKPKIGLTA